MKITRLQLEQLTSAFEDHSEHSWYWDKKSGEILLHTDYDTCGISLEEMGFEQDPEENPDRYIYVEPLESHEGFRNMEHYAESLPEGECKRSLIRTLQGRKPFANFKNVLRDFPDERQAWFDYHNQWLTQKATEFIQDNKLGEIERPS